MEFALFFSYYMLPVLVHTDAAGFLALRGEKRDPVSPSP